MAIQTKYQKDLEDGKIKPKPVVAPPKKVIVPARTVLKNSTPKAAPPKAAPKVNMVRPPLPAAAPKSDERRFNPPPKGKSTFKYTPPASPPIISNLVRPGLPPAPIDWASRTNEESQKQRYPGGGRTVAPGFGT